MGNKQTNSSSSRPKKEGLDFIEKRTGMEGTRRQVLEQLADQDTLSTSITSGGVAFYMPLDDSRSMGSTPTKPPPKKKMPESKSDTYTLQERTLMAEVMSAEILRERVRKARTSEERRQKVLERREKKEQEKKEKYQEKMNMIEKKRKLGKQKVKPKTGFDYKRC